MDDIADEAAILVGDESSKTASISEANIQSLLALAKPVDQISDADADALLAPHADENPIDADMLNEDELLGEAAVGQGEASTPRPAPSVTGASPDTPLEDEERAASSCSIMVIEDSQKVVNDSPATASSQSELVEATSTSSSSVQAKRFNTISTRNMLMRVSHRLQRSSDAAKVSALCKKMSAETKKLGNAVQKQGNELRSMNSTLPHMIASVQAQIIGIQTQIDGLKRSAVAAPILTSRPRASNSLGNSSEVLAALRRPSPNLGSTSPGKGIKRTASSNDNSLHNTPVAKRVPQGSTSERYVRPALPSQPQPAPFRAHVRHSLPAPSSSAVDVIAIDDDEPPMPQSLPRGRPAGSVHTVHTQNGVIDVRMNRPSHRGPRALHAHPASPSNRTREWVAAATATGDQQQRRMAQEQHMLIAQKAEPLQANKRIEVRVPYYLGNLTQWPAAFSPHVPELHCGSSIDQTLGVEPVTLRKDMVNLRVLHGKVHYGKHFVGQKIELWFCIGRPTDLDKIRRQKLPNATSPDVIVTAKPQELGYQLAAAFIASDKLKTKFVVNFSNELPSRVQKFTTQDVIYLYARVAPDHGPKISLVSKLLVLEAKFGSSNFHFSDRIVQFADDGSMDDMGGTAGAGGPAAATSSPKKENAPVVAAPPQPKQQQQHPSGAGTRLSSDNFDLIQH